MPDQRAREREFRSAIITAVRIREREVRSAIITAVREGRDFFVLQAYEHRADGRQPGDDQPYVQFAWRDDLRLQIETQGDPYRDEAYSDTQHRMLRRLGYLPPFELGDDFANWVIMREAEGCEPESVARLMIDTLWIVHGTHFLDLETSRRSGVSYWTYETSHSVTKRDIKAEIIRRYRTDRTNAV